MKIIRALAADIEAVKRITVQTINRVYPRYYPAGAVDFFLNHHSDANIASDVRAGGVYLLLCADDCAVGTVTIKGNEICRLFVLPEHQGKGYGRELISFAEKMILDSHSTIVLDASLPAKAIYLKRGYAPAEFHSIKTQNGDHLCYDVMVKQKQ